MTPFTSVFAKHLAGYIALRRRLGWVFSVQEKTLRHFDRFAVAQAHHGVLTDALARAFAVAGERTTPRLIQHRYMTVRGFAEYLGTFEPRTARLDPKAFSYRKRRRPPYVFTDDELDRVLHTTTQCSRYRVLRLGYHAMIGLAVSCGLRLREVVALDLPDVDLAQGVLTVRQSKFQKDRLVPVHPSTLTVLRAYAAERALRRAHAGVNAFFLSTRGGRFAADDVGVMFRRLVQRVDLHPPGGAPPTFYSLRHTFAVRRLIAWHHAGADVQALLPALATYMGHVAYTYTAHYLTATAELLAAAGDRPIRPTQRGPNG
jgi:integrase